MIPDLVLDHSPRNAEAGHKVRVRRAHIDSKSIQGEERERCVLTRCACGMGQCFDGSKMSSSGPSLICWTSLALPKTHYILQSIASISRQHHRFRRHRSGGPWLGRHALVPARLTPPCPIGPTTDWAHLHRRVRPSRYNALSTYRAPTQRHDLCYVCATADARPRIFRSSNVGLPRSNMNSAEATSSFLRGLINVPGSLRRSVRHHNLPGRERQSPLFLLSFSNCSRAISVFA
jgi:hypothetical protein